MCSPSPAERRAVQSVASEATRTAVQIDHVPIPNSTAFRDQMVVVQARELAVIDPIR